MAVELRLGVKSDMIEYRYSHQWLFRLLAEEGVGYVQLGSQLETYHLPDRYFHDLRKQADDAGVVIDSTFTTHRELGGFFRSEPGFEQVARKNYERYIEVGGLLGATSVGSNPGAVLRDQMGTKAAGLKCYIKHMKELMHYANEHGLKWLTIEPMSCLAEPPTLPEEIAALGQELTEYHNAHPDTTVQVGYCTDIAHGYADRDGKILFDQYDLFEACVPWMYEVHLKNTDSIYNSTFGFTQAERAKGIIDVPQFRQLLIEASDRLPVTKLAGYLEIGGPKLGRDYSDHLLEASLRESLQYLQTAFMEASTPEPLPPRTIRSEKPQVLISPSMMCVDPLNFESALRRVEALGVDMLHIDIMDGHFVPNAPMGLGIVEALRPKTDLPIDVHLMVEDNDFFVELLAPMRVDQISVHVESCIHLDRTLARIREIGAQAGVAINPATPLSAIQYVLERIDYVLVMTVNPGYAGQKMTPASIRKIADCRKLLDDQGYSQIPIQVDGNVSFENIPAMVRAGGVNLVAGTSSIFHRDASWSENVITMKHAIAAGLNTNCP
ncbi:Ribulose-phosphate 3-epimerase [Rosistilla carotiformis]|uniref:Ribulose-phosphate 3-epimerase n=2 Tax=Rosistilla carotiformis TaxID=2528017 RepID=A0A518JTN8_9BACT|nr:Ribulose-phosphate 3-epimerase [Rosistilla carotiformis]